MKIKIISWNVRGVNDPDKRKVIKNFLGRYRADLVCLQETKVEKMNSALVRSLGVGAEIELGSAGLGWFRGGVFFCFKIIVELVWWTLWWGVSPYPVCLEWSKTGSNGFSPECMDRLRID